jgi:HK97 family phage portal protein
MNLFERTKAAIKNLQISFTGTTGREINLRDGFGASAGTRINWSAITADFTQNAAAYACYRTIALNYTQAPIQLQQKNAEGEWEKVSDDPVTALINKPYAPFWDGGALAWAYLGSLLASGNGYLGIEEGAGGLPERLKWLPHGSVTAERNSGSMELIDFYRYTPEGRSPQRVEIADIIHLRYGVNLSDPRYGLSGYAALKQQQYTLQQATNYNANILRNGGVPFAFAAPKNPSTTFSPSEFVDKAKTKVSGDKVGEWLAWNEPIDLTFPNATPENMALDIMQDRPESDIAAVFGVPPQVAGLHVGRLSKTYANVKEARESFWEETVIPLLLMVTCQMAAVLLPRFGYDTKQYRLYPDITQIRPLQPDKDATEKRSRETYQIGAISLATFLTETGRKPEPGDETIYYTGSRGQMMSPVSAEEEPDKVEAEEEESAPKFLRQYLSESKAYQELYGEFDIEDTGSEGDSRRGVDSHLVRSGNGTR